MFPPCGGADDSAGLPNRTAEGCPKGDGQDAHGQHRRTRWNSRAQTRARQGCRSLDPQARDGLWIKPTSSEKRRGEDLAQGLARDGRVNQHTKEIGTDIGAFLDYFFSLEKSK
jgi:hypothetical protein